MDYKKEIIKKINNMSGSQSVYNIFADWIKMLALAISNTMEFYEKIYDKRENEYKGIAAKYTDKELNEFTVLNVLLTQAFEERFEDVLGYIYMNLQVSNKNLGQFFTPYHLCRVMAEMSYPERIKEGYYIEVSEPSCGAGANIIALAEALKSKDINYQETMKVTCQDLDWNAIYMCYVQMSLYGIAATVVQGDTLLNPYVGGYNEHVFITPVLRLNDWKFRNKKRLVEEPESGVWKLATDEEGQMRLIM